MAVLLEIIEMELVCSRAVFGKWRQIEGTYVIGCVFTIVVVFNILLLICVIT